MRQKELKRLQDDEAGIFRPTLEKGYTATKSTPPATKPTTLPMYRCGSRMAENISDDLDHEKTEHDHTADQGVILPDHDHESIIHRDVEYDEWYQLLPIHGLAE